MNKELFPTNPIEPLVTLRDQSAESQPRRDKVALAVSLIGVSKAIDTIVQYNAPEGTSRLQKFVVEDGRHMTLIVQGERDFGANSRVGAEITLLEGGKYNRELQLPTNEDIVDLFAQPPAEWNNHDIRASVINPKANMMTQCRPFTSDPYLNNPHPANYYNTAVYLTGLVVKHFATPDSRS